MHVVEATTLMKCHYCIQARSSRIGSYRQIDQDHVTCCLAGTRRASAGQCPIRCLGMCHVNHRSLVPDAELIVGTTNVDPSGLGFFSVNPCECSLSLPTVASSLITALGTPRFHHHCVSAWTKLDTRQRRLCSFLLSSFNTRNSPRPRSARGYNG